MVETTCLIDKLSSAINAEHCAVFSAQAWGATLIFLFSSQVSGRN